MPGLSGIELTKKVKQLFPEIKILVLTMFNDPSVISDILQAEAEGYILKNTGKQELVNAITKIMEGGTFYSDDVLKTILSQSVKKNKATVIPEKEKLTSRELEILKLVCEEYTTMDIAEKLFISPRTVDTHRKNILEKSGAKTIVGLIKYAYGNNILLPNT
jgi:DNA-binding NarL/FixJ family response regulator